jgi:hypothetical protein
MIQIQKCPENRRSAGGCIQADWIRARIVPVVTSNGIRESNSRRVNGQKAEAAQTLLQHGSVKPTRLST